MRAMVVAACFLASAPAVAATPEAESAAILETILRMEAAWNRGDFPGYMAGFKNPEVVFVSGGKFQDGWQGTLDHYIRDYGGSPDAAMLIGRYRLVRGSRVTEGVNTRLFLKFDGRWLITMNHVSAYDVTASSTAPEAR